MSVTLQIYLTNPNNKYNNIIKDEGFYSSPEYYKAYNSYRKNKSGGSKEPLENLIGAIGGGVSDAANYVLFGKELDRVVKASADEMINKYFAGRPDVKVRL